MTENIKLVVDLMEDGRDALDGGQEGGERAGGVATS